MVLVSVFDSESANMYHFVRIVVRILGLIWIKHELDRINVIGNALAWVFEKEAVRLIMLKEVVIHPVFPICDNGLPIGIKAIDDERVA